MRGLAPALADAGLTVELPLLPGHGTDIADMVPTRWEDWSAAADAAYVELAARCDVGGRRRALHGGHARAVAGRAAPRDRRAGPGQSARRCRPTRTRWPSSTRSSRRGTSWPRASGRTSPWRGPVESAYPRAALARGPLALRRGGRGRRAGSARSACPVLLFSSMRGPRGRPRCPATAWSRASTGPVERVVLERSFHVATLDYDKDEIEARTVKFVTDLLRPSGGMSGTEEPGHSVSAARTAEPFRCDPCGQPGPPRPERGRGRPASPPSCARCWRTPPTWPRSTCPTWRPTAHPLPVENVLRPDEPRAVSRPRRGAGRRTGRGGRSFPGAAHRQRAAMSSARELAAAVRSGERSAREATEEALAAVAARDGEVHAFLDGPGRRGAGPGRCGRCRHGPG